MRLRDSMESDMRKNDDDVENYVTKTASIYASSWLKTLLCLNPTPERLLVSCIR